MKVLNTIFFEQTVQPLLTQINTFMLQRVELLNGFGSRFLRKDVGGATHAYIVLVEIEYRVTVTVAIINYFCLSSGAEFFHHGCVNHCFC